ncbi:MAG: diaminopimelate decarboxylase [Cyanobacteriota bacterium]|nr:diaminopimelate decarboxylase [Cyanobacteriota bacterium]MDY6357881.1 diaminopimelate decarboxylase [Cyanobacteriota bacterium]MDY6364237.1 diaminopimelate decarboxylase [Cyanobacteriota bacterium]MDY6383171.1 diaminopimelate decarboxylase [Cyanobacteriota bacterium]
MPKSANQFLKPLTQKVNSDGNIEIGGCDLVSLAEKFGTPLYVLDEKTIRAICNDYKNAFASYPNTTIMFASKALCTQAVTAVMDSEDVGFDTVSGGEIYTVYKSSVDMKKVLFNGNNKSFDELNLALDLGVGRISVDNFYELALLSTIAQSKNKTVDILLRITPGIECHTHEYIQTGHLDSKFGFDLTQIDDAVDLILGEYTNLKLHGLHAHIGSQIFESAVYIDEIDILCKEIARLDEKFNLKLDEINIGGGLGVKYTSDDTPLSIYDVGKMITDRLNTSVKKYNIAPPALFLEPGRSMISMAGVTLYTVGSSKQVPHGRKYVAVDGGMADNPRPSLYQAKYCAEVANKKDETQNEKVTICGRYCESGDVLIEEIELPSLNEGDILCVYNTGAYNYSMASNYNRVEKPAMVLLNDGEADEIVVRETLEDLIRNDVIPDRLKK